MTQSWTVPVGASVWWLRAVWWWGLFSMANGLLAGQAGDGETVLIDSDYGSLEQAVAAAGSARARIVVTGTHVLVASLTVPPNVSLKVTETGRVVVPTGSRLTLLAPPEAEPRPWLGNALPGQGRVSFSSGVEVYPDWWVENAEPGHTDMAGAMQAAVDSGANRVRFLDRSYRNTRVTEITASDLELVGGGKTTIHTIRESPMNTSTVDERTPSPHIKLSFAFEISGDVEQKNVVIRNLAFTGQGYWGGVYSSLLYPHDGWGPGGYPNVDRQAYATTRRGCRLSMLSFATPYYEAIALTCVAGTVEDIQVTNGQNARNHGNIVVRYTNGAAISRVTLDGCRYKNINTSYVDGLAISDVIIREAHGGVDGVGVYFGHFLRNATLANFRFNSTRPFEEFIKISYYASDVRVSNCTLAGTGYIMIQAGQRVSLHGVNMTTSGPRALQLIDYNGPPYPALPPVDVRIIDCRFISTATAAGPRKVVDLSYGLQTEFMGNEVVGNVYANPAKGLRFVRNTVTFSPEADTGVPAALYLQDFRGDGTVLLRDNRITSGADLYAVYLNGAVGPANIEIVNNLFSYPLRSGYGIVANYITSGKFLYAGNQAPGQEVDSVLHVRYEDSSHVTIK